jgi:hypothetical protein
MRKVLTMNTSKPRVIFVSSLLFAASAFAQPELKGTLPELSLLLSNAPRIVQVTGEEKLEVIPAGEFFPKRTYEVVLRKGRILTPQARRFISLLLTSAQPSAGGNGNGAQVNGAGK